jgi:restriction system protein
MDQTSKLKQSVAAVLFPIYSQVRYCLAAWDGEKIKTIRAMMKDIENQTGTPQNPVDWSDPDHWIDERLSGESLRLAQKIWCDSQKT